MKKQQKTNEERVDGMVSDLKKTFDAEKNEDKRFLLTFYLLKTIIESSGANSFKIMGALHYLSYQQLQFVDHKVKEQEENILPKRDKDDKFSNYFG